MSFSDSSSEHHLLDDDDSSAEETTGPNPIGTSPIGAITYANTNTNPISTINPNPSVISHTSATNVVAVLSESESESESDDEPIIRKRIVDWKRNLSGEDVHEWRCPICHQNEHLPKVITVCGHTFCEDCIVELEYCSQCRIEFDQNYQVVTNWSLVPKSTAKSHATESGTITIEDSLERMKKYQEILARQRSQSVIKTIFKELEKQMGSVTNDPKTALLTRNGQLLYRITLQGPIETDVLREVKVWLKSHQMEVTINKYLSVHDRSETLQFLLNFKGPDIESQPLDGTHYINVPGV